MNTKNLFAVLMVVIVLFTPAVAQHSHEDQPKDSPKQHKMPDMMGKPTFERTTDGLNIRVWLITQTEHKQMMKDHGMIGSVKKDRHEMMGMMHGNPAGKDDHQMMNDRMQHEAKDMDEETMKWMLAGTHHIMALVEDEASKTERDSAAIEVQIGSPTEKNSTVTLTRMMKHYGGGLTLDERGEYKITVVVRDGDRVIQASFEYGVRSTEQ
jgi:hypothetical protein